MSGGRKRRRPDRARGSRPTGSRPPSRPRGPDRELRTRLRETETLLAVSGAVGTTLDLTETLRRVARETARALGADMVGAFLADVDRRQLRPIAGYHVPPEILRTSGDFAIPIA